MSFSCSAITGLDLLDEVASRIPHVVDAAVFGDQGVGGGAALGEKQKGHSVAPCSGKG